MIRYEDVLSSNGLAAYREERRQRFFRIGLEFCRSNLGARFEQADETSGLSHVAMSYDVGKLFGLRSERDHLKLLIAVAHWGLGFATDPRLTDRLIACGWLKEDRSRHSAVRVSKLLRAVDGWHWDVRPEDGWDKAIRATAEISTGVASGRAALRLAHDIWPNVTQQMSPDARNEFTVWLDDAPLGCKTEGRTFVLYALLGLRLGYWYLSEPTYGSLRRAVSGDKGKPPRFDDFLAAAVALPMKIGE